MSVNGFVKIKIEEENPRCEDAATGTQTRKSRRLLISSSKRRDHKELEDQNRSSETTQESSSRHRTSFDVDDAQTLGEILAYCQLMYRAIQKLDEKLEDLQAKVMRIESVTTEHQKAPSKPAAQHLLSNSCHVEVSPPVSMPTLVRVDSPLPPASVEVTKTPSLSPAPQLHSFLGLHSSVDTTHAPHVIPIEAEEDEEIEERECSPASKGAAKGSSTIKTRTGTETLRWVGSKKRNVCISQAKLQKAQKLSKPSRAVRFLFRNIFSVEELQCSNTRGNPALGVKKLDPNKISAIREWLAKRFPECDLSERGRDWRKCQCVMNATARYLRLMARKRQLKMENGRKTPISQEIEDFQYEQEHGMDQATEQYAAGKQAHISTAGMGQLEEPLTAEIDVELSESDGEDSTSAKRLLQIQLDADLDTQFAYLGNPERQVRVPQHAMTASLQRMRPELAVRVLIKSMFPTEVLVASNVYGHIEAGIQPLDLNKVAALREHLQERFPWLMLGEDGRDWKVCVGAINGTIRRLRHEFKMRKKGI